MTTTPAERSAGPFDEQLSSRLLQQRIIVLGQEVDDTVANRLCAALLLLSAEDPHRDISLYINSPGGSVSAGLAIYDTMLVRCWTTARRSVRSSSGRPCLSA